MGTATPQPKANMGKPEVRLDAIAKVTGSACYGADQPVANPAFAWMVTSSIAKGRIAKIDTTESMQIPGVLHIMTHENRPSLGEFKFFGEGGEASTAKPPLSSDRIEHDGDSMRK